MVPRRGVGSGVLGPGLTSESADAASGCAARRSAGRVPGFPGTHRRCRSDLPVLCKRPGFTGPRASGCVPSLQPEKRDGIDHRRDPRGRAHRRRARSDRRAARRRGVPGHPGRLLLGWLGGFGTVCLAGIEGTGSYGAGLSRHITTAGIRVVEVDRCDRQDRRRQGKSRPARRGQRRPGRPVRPGPRRTERPRRRRRGHPRVNGRQAQRPRRADPDHQPGQVPDRDRAR